VLIALISGYNGSSPRPQPPIPPARIAVFHASPDAAGEVALAITLIAGKYQISYQTERALRPEDAQAGPNRFVADFRRGTVAGNLETAETLILIGSIDLKIGALSGTDSLYANVLSQGRRANAYFEYISPRGPPFGASAAMEKKVVVVGELNSVRMPDTFGDSATNIRILDLDPTEREQREYELAKERHEREIEAHREAERVRAGKTRPRGR
jgi:hypothetical protein